MRHTDQLPVNMSNDDASPNTQALAIEPTNSQRDLSVGHEVTRILPKQDVRLVAEPNDAPALLRIVEEQARDLVKLRRALVGANSLAEERRKIIERGALPNGKRSSKASRPREEKASSGRFGKSEARSRLP